MRRKFDAVKSGAQARRRRSAVAMQSTRGMGSGAKLLGELSRFEDDAFSGAV